MILGGKKPLRGDTAFQAKFESYFMTMIYVSSNCQYLGNKLVFYYILITYSIYNNILLNSTKITILLLIK